MYILLLICSFWIFFISSIVNYSCKDLETSSEVVDFSGLLIGLKHSFGLDFSVWVFGLDLDMTCKLSLL